MEANKRKGRSLTFSSIVSDQAGLSFQPPKPEGRDPFGL